jgi:hypothetical protein
MPVELTDGELDAVAAGALVSGNIGGGLINVQANDLLSIDTVNINVLDNNQVVKDVGVGVGVAAGVLGNAGALGVGHG